MAIIVSCPSCRTQYRVDPARLRDGRGKLRCAKCRTVFPVQAGEGEATSPPPAPPAPSPPRLDIALLAFESGPARKRFQGAMQALGLRVALADDGPNALDVARRSRPRLIVAAHWLPGLTGAELVTAIRDEPALGATKTLLVGGPPLRLSRGASVAAVRGVDAHLPLDAKEADIDACLRALLGLAGGSLPRPPDEELRRHARVAVEDLRLYLGGALESGRAAGKLDARVSEYISRARAGCLEAFPELRHVPRGLAAWDEEIRLALRR